MAKVATIVSVTADSVGYNQVVTYTVAGVTGTFKTLLPFDASQADIQAQLETIMDDLDAQDLTTLNTNVTNNHSALTSTTVTSS